MGAFQVMAGTPAAPRAIRVEGLRGASRSSRGVAMTAQRVGGVVVVVICAAAPAGASHQRRRRRATPAAVMGSRDAANSSMMRATEGGEDDAGERHRLEGS